jgi:hypothetical protein
LLQFSQLNGIFSDHLICVEVAMFSFLTANNNKPAQGHTASILTTLTSNARILTLGLLGSSTLTTAAAQDGGDEDNLVCYSNNYPTGYELRTNGYNAKDIVAKMSEICGDIHNIGDVLFCPTLGTDHNSYGSGVFGGARCVLEYMQSEDGKYQPTSCQDTVINDNCPGGYGTTTDIYCTVGLSVVAVLLVASGLGFWAYKRKKGNALTASTAVQAPDLEQALVPEESKVSESHRSNLS